MEIPRKQVQWDHQIISRWPVFTFQLFCHSLCGFEQVTCSSDLSLQIYLNCQCCPRCILWNTSPMRCSWGGGESSIKIGKWLKQYVKGSVKSYNKRIFNFILLSSICYLTTETLFKLTPNQMDIPWEISGLEHLLSILLGLLFSSPCLDMEF